MRRVLTPLHAKPDGFHSDFILLPLGYRINAAFKNAPKGQILAFYGGGKAKVGEVYHLSLNDPFTGFLFRFRYGVPFERVFKVWQRNFRALGYNPDAISKTECLLVEYETIKDEE